MVLVRAILFILRQFPLVCKNIHFFLLLLVFIALLLLMLVPFTILLFPIFILVIALSTPIRIVLGMVIGFLLRIILVMRVWGSLTVMLFVLIVFFMLVLVELILLLMMDYFAVILVLVIIVLIVDLPVLVEAGRLRDERLNAFVGRGWVLVQEKECVVSCFLMSHNLDFLAQIVLALPDAEDLVDDGR